MRRRRVRQAAGMFWKQMRHASVSRFRTLCGSFYPSVTPYQQYVTFAENSFPALRACRSCRQPASCMKALRRMGAPTSAPARRRPYKASQMDVFEAALQAVGKSWHFIGLLRPTTSLWAAHRVVRGPCSACAGSLSASDGEEYQQDQWAVRLMSGVRRAKKIVTYWENLKRTPLELRCYSAH